ncbi:carbohydrate ABC transporter permease [Kaistia dalseonensis]|uniref:ABC-type glycerol-3-phosphate transport system permease component n=1 Tax=Kaistia dalseonensis TaxID=410840 RepID=A0ABU0H2R9_9HYPH|nr:carbohydrate ABC transporter permease [Kaistia dalseonensis]MCX5494021.1 carbohydrate ABC transporter permease [Kaistia dalseonensis]MDQ0436599.1 ABC-type glycerol-3-phosphate transport system permease component [Kaistia dalseonensis]
MSDVLAATPRIGAGRGVAMPPLGQTLGYAALVIAAVQALGPVVWIIFGSLKSKPEFYTNAWGLPRAWMFRNYADAFVVAKVGDYVWNSLIVVALGLLILLFTASTTAYALARFKFRGREAIAALILMTMMVPPDILTIPLFVVLRSLGLLGSFFGLACIYAVGGFGMSVFLLRGYFMSVPVELEEAARIDGAGPLSILRHVILPMTLPGFLSVVIIQAMGMWNDLYLAFVFLRDPASATVPVGLLNFFHRESIDWPRLLAALTALTIPVLILYAMFQKKFVEGFTSGAVK